MLKSESVTFRANARQVLKQAIRIVQAAGYENLEVRQDRNSFSYTGPRGRLIRAQLVVVTVLDLDDDETCVSVQVRPLAVMTFTEGRLQQELLDFLLGELEDEFPKVRQRRPNRTPPRARKSGCLPGMLLLSAVVTAGGVAVRCVI